MIDYVCSLSDMQMDEEYNNQHELFTLLHEFYSCTNLSIRLEFIQYVHCSTPKCERSLGIGYQME